jgi:hypothetical protein
MAEEPVEHEDDFFVTKYCMTTGEISVERLFWTEGEDYARQYKDRASRGNWEVSFRIGAECFCNREDAVVNAKARRDKRLTSLEKSILQTRKMEFV